MLKEISTLPHTHRRLLLIPYSAGYSPSTLSYFFLTLLYFTHVTSPGCPSLADSTLSLILSLLLLTIFLASIPTYPLRSFNPCFFFSACHLQPSHFFTFLPPTLFHVLPTSHVIASVPNPTQLSSFPLTASCTHWSLSYLLSYIFLPFSFPPSFTSYPSHFSFLS